MLRLGKMSQKELRKFSEELEDAENTARIRLFGKAARKYRKLANWAKAVKPDLHFGMKFLAHLYDINDTIVSQRDPHRTGVVREFLKLRGEMEEVEVTVSLLGSGFGVFTTTRIFNEIYAIHLMYEGMESKSAKMVRDAAELFLTISDEFLFYSRYMKPLKRRVTGTRAALECEARAQIIEGTKLADPNPSGAIPHFMIAVRALRAARLFDDEVVYRRMLMGLRAIRTCWFCGRRIQGSSHLVWMESEVSEYFVNLLRENNEDLRMVHENKITACIPCFKAINKEADRIANIYYARLQEEINELRRIIASLARRT